jgi:hypothetical protein
MNINIQKQHKSTTQKSKKSQKKTPKKTEKNPTATLRTALRQFPSSPFSKIHENASIPPTHLNAQIKINYPLQILHLTF